MDFSFVFPVDGVMLTDAAGKKTVEGLKINCIINAPPGRSITVNGVPCTASTNQYHVETVLKGYKTLLIAKDTQNGCETSIKVYYLKNAHKKYRFSLDDNIWCFQNIAKHAGDYKSIFEDPYLNLIKTMHDKYDTKFHINIYYECPEFGGFNLTQMPDQFKPEWKYNSDWLRLSFHAKANLPDRPYIRASFDQAKFEHDQVVEQIIRFAGEEAFAGPVTTIHWGDATTDTVRALRSSGVKAFVGSFNYHDPKNVSIRYYLNAEQCALLNIYGFYYDNNEDVYFFRYGASMQHIKVEDIPKEFELFEKQNPLYTFKEMCVHEQYFYPHYIRYMPDYYQRFDTAIKWCIENGYEASFVKDVLEL
ncbi:MAG TPA: hypothetical protein DDZ89_00550 [Clostridiales bacterium]|nr:hypothetical protein [Clostridiales bacterium]